jgi:hypothetical protein
MHVKFHVEVEYSTRGNAHSGLFWASHLIELNYNVERFFTEILSVHFIHFYLRPIQEQL